MRKITLPLLAFVLLLSCSKKTAPTKTEPQPPMPDPPQPAVVAGPGAMVTAGKTLFDTKCGRCHALKEPATFTPDKWVPIIDRMAVKAKLVEDEKKQVLAYVQYYAKK